MVKADTTVLLEKSKKTARVALCELQVGQPANDMRDKQWFYNLIINKHKTKKET